MKNIPNPSGPIDPPSLSEIYEITARRQRNRHRLAQGTLVAVAVAGIGFGLEATRSNERPVPVEFAADPAAADEPLVNVPTTTSTTIRVMPEGAPSCFLATASADSIDDGTRGFPVWMSEGTETFLAIWPMSADGVETLAEAWEIPFDEAKALVGLAARHDVSLNESSIDDALDDWSSSGFHADQLTAIASEWNTTAISVKVLQFIGSDEIDASLQACGLT